MKIQQNISCVFLSLDASLPLRAHNSVELSLFESSMVELYVQMSIGKAA